MNTLLKVGLGLTAAGGVILAVHHVHAAEPAAPAAAYADSLRMPANLEAQIRAMARAHAPAGQAYAAEAHLMAMIKAHFAEIAKDPAMVAHVNEMMAKADSGDQDALQAVHEALIELVHGGH